MKRDRIRHLSMYGAYFKKDQIEFLKELQKMGYKWAVREQIYVHFFSLKPKKYRDTNSWGYREADINKSAALMAYPIKLDTHFIKETDRSPHDLDLLIKKIEGADK